MESIERDVRWLGFEWTELHHASDYFEQLYQYAVQLIEQGQAYVDSLSAEQIRAYRGILTESGKESPDRNRSIAENLDLFSVCVRVNLPTASMCCALRSIWLRPILICATRRCTGFAACIIIARAMSGVFIPCTIIRTVFPMLLKGLPILLCTWDLNNHRPLYDWVLDQLQTPCHPQQIEFARLQLEYTIVSKRKLNQLVMEKHVHGWDDPRMPTIAGLRRAGFTPKAIRDFCERIGLTKQNSWIEMGVLEYCIREDLNENALRAMAVLQPLRVVIDNYPEDKTEELEISNHPQS